MKANKLGVDILKPTRPTTDILPLHAEQAKVDRGKAETSFCSA
jgi:hypothetical protein